MDDSLLNFIGKQIKKDDILLQYNIYKDPFCKFHSKQDVLRETMKARDVFIMLDVWGLLNMKYFYICKHYGQGRSLFVYLYLLSDFPSFRP